MIKHLLAGFVIASAVTCSAIILEDGMYAEMTTSKGKITCQLFFKKTPMTVCNFAGLAQGTIKSNKGEGVPFYDGLIFHRVIPDFMIQGGCPIGNGTGNPGYKFPDEIVSDLKHDKPYMLSMANSGPNTNGSQFFITVKPTPWLDGKHTVFGKVIEGTDVVDAIVSAPQGAQNKPGEDIVIQSVKIIRKGKAETQFKTDQKAFDGYLAAHAEKQEKSQNAAAVKELKIISKKWPKAVKTKSGLMYIILKEGAGAKPKAGTLIKAHYTGMLLDGTKFDSSVDRGEPLEFAVGTGRVIPGWDEGLMDMKKGEQRTLIIPPNLGYGSQGAGGVIPPNAYLVFEVELVDFQ